MINHRWAASLHNSEGTFDQHTHLPSLAMQGRPSSSARPSTSARSSTAFDRDQFQYQQQHLQQQQPDEIEEEYEESDDEDVFAFVPPSTADQKRQSTSFAFGNHVQYPEPTFDPWGRQTYPLSPPIPAAAASTDLTTDTSPSPPDATAIPPSPACLHLYLYNQPLSPPPPSPSTDSHPSTGISGSDFYHLKRLGAATSKLGGVDDIREIEKELQADGENEAEEKGDSTGHSHSHSQSDPQKSDEGGTGIPQATSSLADSLSMTQRTMADDESRNTKIEFHFDGIEEEDSPYPEVRASVSNIDDPDMPAMTLRMWFVGLLLCMTSSALNVFFNFRDPAPNVVPLALLLISYPIGKLLAFILPITSYRIPVPHLPRSMFPLHQPTRAPFRLIVNLLLPLTYPRVIEFSLNPGPWNIKEHVLIYIMANVAVGNPYAMNAIVVGEVYYGIAMGYWFSLTLVLATQLTGFALAGLCRRFLVWPASMIWPQNLVACTLLNTLHAENEDDGIGMYGGMPGSGTKGMTRFRFFLITMSGSFFFFFLPGYLFEALSVFSYICWAAPLNVPVNQLFGVRTGLGMGILTFDWTQISWIGSPLMVPWWAAVNIFVGFVMFYWILTPVLYYTNSWDLAYFPISADEPFDRFGHVYNVSRVLRSDDRFNEVAYYAYSPLYLSATYAVTYLLAFALSTAAIVHTGLYHRQRLINGIKRTKVEPDDIHAKLMTLWVLASVSKGII